MHTLEIPDKKIRIEYPSCLEDLSPEQAVFFVRQYLNFMSGSISGEQFRIYLAWNFIGLTKSLRYNHLMSLRKKTQQEQDLLDGIHSNVYKISETLDSFFQEEKQDGKPVKILRFFCIKQIIPNIGRFYGPASGMTDCSFWEYKLAHEEYAEYCKTTDSIHLFRLAAILYRPRKLFLGIRKLLPFYNGRQRIPLTPGTNPRSIDARARKLQSRARNYWAVYYSFLFFSSIEKYLLTGRPVIDGKEIDLSVLYEGSAQKGENIGLTGILYSLAETKVFGDINQTADAGLYDIIARLYQVAVMYKNAKNTNDSDKDI